MKKKIIVLGAGMVGSVIARDLAGDANLDVAMADISRKNLAKLADVPNLTGAEVDLARPESIKAAVRTADAVVGALPSVFGLAALRAVIESDKPYADISFMPEDALSLDALAKQHGVTAVVDCGVAPGLANMAIGHSHAGFDQTDRVLFYVGGLPKRRHWPYQYKAPFAPSDVLEEYTRPVRMIEGGKLVVKLALSEPELIDFPPVGTLEAFNTDGLRSLVRTIPAANMQEKTLRYPGHIELMRVLRETGYFGLEPVEVGGVRIRPRDLTAKLLFPKWTLEPGEEEFTILRVIVEGRKGGRRVRHTYELYDEYDAAKGMTSMARTTGFPCAIVARMLAHGELVAPGVLPPERLGMRGGMMERISAELAARGVNLSHHVDEIEESPAAL